MTGAMYAAIAGLKTHMQKLNVIGNNTANVNTYSYKAGVTGFEESLYTSLRNSSAGGNQYGGTNAAQIGYGSKVATIDLNMGCGQYAATGINSDLYLTQPAFFLVGDKSLEMGYKPNAADLTLSRYGRFKIDSEGYLVDFNGRCVYGFLPQGNEEDGSIKEDIDPETGESHYQWDTALRPLRLPLENLTTQHGQVAGSAFYPANYGAPVSSENDAEEPEYLGEYDAVEAGDDPQLKRSHRIDAETVNLSVSSTGVITAINSNTGSSELIGIIALANPVNPNGLTKLDGPYYQAMEGGNAGELSVGTCGHTVTGYLNNIPEEEGLEQNAEMAGAVGTCQIVAGGLELSNTDVATEFADLITTQRGFQANTKIITVTDEMLSDLVSMKR